MLIVTLLLVWLCWHFRNVKRAGAQLAWLVLLAITFLACVASLALYM